MTFELLPDRLERRPVHGGAVDGDRAAIALQRDRVMLQQGEQGAKLRLLPRLGLRITEELDGAGEVRRESVGDEHPVTAKLAARAHPGQRAADSVHNRARLRYIRLMATARSERASCRERG